MLYTKNMVFVTGQAHPSKDDVISRTYEVISLCLVVDRDTDRIVDACCNTVMQKTADFLLQILCGHSLVDDLDAIVQELQSRFFALMQKALIAALKDAQNRYLLEFPEKRK